MFGGLGFLLIEVRRHRRLTNEALAALLRQRAALSRRVFESRLAAMQAQVEPQFLFNTLVDIEALYERDPKSAARILDDLITYLRVALPRLRETGATAGTHLADEIDLVRAYLEVVSARHDGRPQARFVVEPECAQARFYPMLLLPLVQRGVRGERQDEPPPADRVEITAKRVHDDVFVALRVHAPGLCEEHPELARVRERLEGLYGGRATLYCGEPKPGITDFTLKIPFDPQ
jgi:LytS/YehU family sensor histidine kinase